MRTIAGHGRIDPGNLSRFAHGKRGLSAKSLESLCRSLGIEFVRTGSDDRLGRSLLEIVRQAIADYDGSLRAIAKHTGIDAGNLSRFRRGKRAGLSIENLERLGRFLKLEIAWRGTLVVAMRRESKSKFRLAADKAVHEIECAEHAKSGFRQGRLFGVKKTENGNATFRGIPIGTTVDIFIDGRHRETVDMLDTEQEFTILSVHGFSK
jgi:transcriptional regulator with XRE-family HTH domain